jgi:hypothetical protein
MSSEPPSPPQPNPAGRLSVWLLAAVSLFGLIGFIVTFGMILARTVPAPQAAMAPVMAIGQVGPQGERGPPGLQGPRGPAGDTGIRIVRSDCATGSCTVECEHDEMLLSAHCGAGRGQAIYPNERSALCRTTLRTRFEIVAACAKASAP